MYDFVSHILLIAAEKVRILFFRLLQTILNDGEFQLQLFVFPIGIL